ARLYRNVVPQRGNWLQVRALTGKRDALGAQVRVQTPEGKYLGLVPSGGSYMTSHDPRVHFGLGQAKRVDHIEVLWPDGKREHFKGGSTNRRVHLQQGTGEPSGGGKP